MGDHQVRAKRGRDCVLCTVCGVRCAVAHTNVAFFPSDACATISESAQDLIANLIVVDPTKRFTAQQVLDHPWVSGVAAKPAGT